jgi:hypothetical protein
MALGALMAFGLSVSLATVSHAQLKDKSFDRSQRETNPGASSTAKQGRDTSSGICKCVYGNNSYSCAKVSDCGPNAAANCKKCSN